MDKNMNGYHSNIKLLRESGEENINGILNIFNELSEKFNFDFIVENDEISNITIYYEWEEITSLLEALIDDKYISFLGNIDFADLIDDCYTIEESIQFTHEKLTVLSDILTIKRSKWDRYQFNLFYDKYILEDNLSSFVNYDTFDHLKSLIEKSKFVDARNILEDLLVPLQNLLLESKVNITNIYSKYPSKIQVDDFSKTLYNDISELYNSKPDSMSKKLEALYYLLPSYEDFLIKLHFSRAIGSITRDLDRSVNGIFEFLASYGDGKTLDDNIMWAFTSELPPSNILSKLKFKNTDEYPLLTFNILVRIYIYLLSDRLGSDENRTYYSKKIKTIRKIDNSIFKIPDKLNSEAKSLFIYIKDFPLNVINEIQKELGLTDDSNNNDGGDIKKPKKDIIVKDNNIEKQEKLKFVSDQDYQESCNKYDKYMNKIEKALVDDNCEFDETKKKVIIETSYLNHGIYKQEALILKRNYNRKRVEAQTPDFDSTLPPWNPYYTEEEMILHDDPIIVPHPKWRVYKNNPNFFLNLEDGKKYEKTCDIMKDIVKTRSYEIKGNVNLDLYCEDIPDDVLEYRTDPRYLQHLYSICKTYQFKELAYNMQVDENRRRMGMKPYSMVLASRFGLGRVENICNQKKKFYQFAGKKYLKEESVIIYHPLIIGYEKYINCFTVLMGNGYINMNRISDWLFIRGFTNTLYKVPDFMKTKKCKTSYSYLLNILKEKGVQDPYRGHLQKKFINPILTIERRFEDETVRSHFFDSDSYKGYYFHYDLACLFIYSIAPSALSKFKCIYNKIMKNVYNSGGYKQNPSHIDFTRKDLFKSEIMIYRITPKVKGYNYKLDEYSITIGDKSKNDKYISNRDVWVLQRIRGIDNPYKVLNDYAWKAGKRQNRYNFDIKGITHFLDYLDDETVIPNYIFDNADMINIIPENRPISEWMRDYDDCNLCEIKNRAISCKNRIDYDREIRLNSLKCTYEEYKQKKLRISFNDIDNEKYAFQEKYHARYKNDVWPFNIKYSIDGFSGFYYDENHYVSLYRYKNKEIKVKIEKIDGLESRRRYNIMKNIESTRKYMKYLSFYQLTYVYNDDVNGCHRGDEKKKMAKREQKNMKGYNNVLAINDKERDVWENNHNIFKYIPIEDKIEMDKYTLNKRIELNRV